LQKASIRFSVLNQANCLLKIHTFEFTGLARPHAFAGNTGAACLFDNHRLASMCGNTQTKHGGLRPQVNNHAQEFFLRKVEYDENIQRALIQEVMDLTLAELRERAKGTSVSDANFTSLGDYEVRQSA